jgi:uncharacterized membrane protein YedE/YeeE
MDRGAWYLVGPLMGLVIVGLLWVTNRPLGALGGYVDLHGFARKPSAKAGWRLFFLGGVVLGGLIAAIVAGGPHPSLAYDLAGVSGTAQQLALLATAGVLMGYGARTAGGCTSGHGLCGSALASPASWVATGTFMATAIAAEHLFHWFVGGAS